MENARPAGWSELEIAALRSRLRAGLAMTGPGGRTAEEVVTAVRRVAPAGARITVDSGAHMFSAMGLWQADRPNDVLKSNGLSTMGFALPAAIAAALEEPARPVIAMTGDGGLHMCLAELATAARLGCRIVVVVFNDSRLSSSTSSSSGSSGRAVASASGRWTMLPWPGVSDAGAGAWTRPSR